MRSLAVIVCFAMACDAGEKSAPPLRTSGSAGSGSAESPVAITRDAIPRLQFLPGDTDLVLQIDVAALRQAKLWQTYAREVAGLVMPGFAGCDYDPLRDVSSVSVGIPLKSERGVFVVRGLDRDKTLQCLRTSKVESNTSVRFDGDFVTLTNKSGAINMLTFVDKTTMVMQGSKNPTKESLTEVLRHGDALAGDARFVAAFRAAAKGLRPAAALTVVSRPGSPEVAAKWSAMGAHLEQLYGSVHLSDRLDVRFSFVLGSLPEATNFASLLQSQRQSPQIKQMFDRFDVIAQGATVTFDVGMTEAQLASIAGMIKAMLPQ